MLQIGSKWAVKDYGYCNAFCTLSHHKVNRRCYQLTRRQRAPVISYMANAVQTYYSSKFEMNLKQDMRKMF